MRYKTFLILGLLILILSGCSPVKYKLPKYEFMIVNEQHLQDFEVEDVRKSLMMLDTTRHQFNNNPDFVIYAHTSLKKFDMFCVYLDDELIYHGDVFKAMLDDLTDQKSSCLQMNETCLELMRDLDDSYK